MKRSTILLILGCTLLAFGYTTTGSSVSKIYLHGTMLIRTTPGEDIRFYDLSVPSSVREIGMMAISGNSDVAATGNIMYADRNHDLVVFDISDPSRPRALDTVESLFYRSGSAIADELNGRTSGTNEFGGSSGCAAEGCESGNESVDPDFNGSGSWGSGGSISDYQTLSFSNGSVIGANNVTRNAAAQTANTGSGTSNPGGGNRREGTGGSLARFMIVGNRLYCIDDRDLISFDITDPARPVFKTRSEIGWMIETIFYAKYHLFIGGQQGVYIYDVEDNRDPQYRGEFQHAERCDPVVVDGDRAYVTLRGGSPCGGFTNQMDILDVRDVRNPRLLKSYDKLNSPYGLAVRDGIAFVCDGPSGLRVLNVGNPDKITECAKITDITPLDVIWHQNLLIVTASEGLFLYDAADPCNPKKFGKMF